LVRTGVPEAAGGEAASATVDAPRPRPHAGEMVTGAAAASASADAVSHGTLADARRSAAECRTCELWERSTQTVFGEGPVPADVMLVGEQPGHEEDLAGRPFVGPAGLLLDRALEAAGLERRSVYVTNLVKHFNWEPRGKWRIHKKPTAWHLRACRPWFDSELAAVQPRVIVCLGATAAQALLGRGVRVTQSQGQAIPSTLAPHVVATLHPSAVLRAPDDVTRQAAMTRLVKDLTMVAKLVAVESGTKGA
jgi:uracil-DNA glycosylase family protein